MKKIVFGLIALLLGIIAAAPAVNAESEINMGNTAVSRANLDASSAFAIVDTNKPAQYAGKLVRFEYWANNNYPFRFLLVNSANKVKWVSDQITPAAAGAGTYIPAGGVAVEQGWNLGAYFLATSTIPYETSGTLAKYTSQGVSQPMVNDTLTVNTANRTYSMLAVGDSTIKPGTTEFTAPANNSTTTMGTTVTFKWETASTTAPTSYQFQYFKDNAYTASEVDYTVNLDATQRQVAFVDAGTYYLRVRVKDGNDAYSDWSNDAADPFKITVKAANTLSNNATTTVSGATTTLSIKDVLAKKTECMKGNWSKSQITGGPFKNQGQCVAHYNQMIMGHIQNLINQILKLHQQLQVEVKKQNDIAKGKGYANWGEYVKAQKGKK